MTSSELDRLRNDVDTLRTLAGMDLPFDRFDVRGMLVLGCCAVLPAVAGLTGVELRWLLLGSAVPFVIAVLGVMGRNYRAAHPGKACPQEKRKEYRLGVPVTLAIFPLLPGFHVWATRSGAPADVAHGCVLLFVGFLLFIQGIMDSARRSAILPGVVAMAGGLLWPYLEILQLWTFLWSGVAVALVGASIIMRCQLAASDPDDRSN